MFPLYGNSCINCYIAFAKDLLSNECNLSLGKIPTALRITVAKTGLPTQRFLLHGYIATGRVTRCMHTLF